MGDDRKHARATMASHPSKTRRKKPRDTDARAVGVLVVDVGGTHIKVFQPGHQRTIEIDSGRKMTAKKMARRVLKAVRKGDYRAVSIGYPGPVLHGEPIAEPNHLGGGWVGFDYKKAFGKPVRVVNDAAMQALGSYRGRRMLFLGLGTGLGSALIVNGGLEPLELAHLPYRKGRTFEDYLGKRGLARLGKKKWRRAVNDVVDRLRKAVQVEDVVIGGGNVKHLRRLPTGARRGSNAAAARGGTMLWVTGVSDTGTRFTFGSDQTS